MSDSESSDLDDRIRYKTESVRNKSEITHASRKKSKNVYREHKDSSRYRKRHSRSPYSKESTYKKYKKREKKKTSSSRSSSTSSSDHRTESKFTRRESKEFFLTDSKKIESHVQNKTKSSLNDQIEVIRNEIIGPALPSHLLGENPDGRPTRSKESLPSDFNLESRDIIKNNINCTKLESCIGPSLPPNIGRGNLIEQNQQTLQDTQIVELPSYIGPQMPPHLLNNDKRKGLKEDIDTPRQSQLLPSLASLSRVQRQNADIMIGPSLPPHLRKKPEDDPCSESIMQAEEDSQSLASISLRQPQKADRVIIVGPTLPPHLRKKIQEEIEESPTKVDMQTEEEDVYGPLPTGISNYSLSHEALEERALQLKIDQLMPKGQNEPVRESWMIELPTAKAANFGLGPRQFRNRSGPDLSDRSSWTDLPGDKNKKKGGDVPVDLKAEAELRETRKRDKEQEMLTKKHKRKEKSLLKMHKEKLQNEKKGEKPSERRPFSRDIDLQVNRFDDAQKQAIMKKAQLLDDRFSSGKSKFL